MTTKRSIEERFWEKVDVRVPDECWEWKAGKYPDGYGTFWYDKRNYGAHVFSYMLHRGSTNGLFVCHTCDNHGCVNPNHLFLGTPKDNTQDMIRKGRLNRKRTLGGYCSGERNKQTKLSIDVADSIRQEYRKGIRGHGMRSLSKKYGVRVNTIYHIVNFITWRQ